jgi:peptide/nickel transport system substrate-binding protein
VLKPENVTAVDAQTVRVQLTTPYGPFFAAIPILMIVNEKLVKAHDKDGDWGATWVASNDAGSGAYKLIPETYTPLEKVDMERFEGHFAGWKHNTQPISRVEIRPSAVTSTRVLALLNGSLDMTDTYLPVDQVENIQKSANVHVTRNETMRIFLFRMNNKKPPFDNINARKCFAHAFNYAGFIAEILKGNAQRDPAPLPNTLWGFPKDVVGYEYDLDKAKDYFKKAVAEGAPMKRPIELHAQQDLEQAVQASQVFQADLATLGITVKIVGDTFANMTTLAAKSKPRPTCGCTGSAPISSIPRIGLGRCTTASSTAPGRRRPGIRTTRSMHCCARPVGSPIRRSGRRSTRTRSARWSPTARTSGSTTRSNLPASPIASRASTTARSAAVARCAG